VPAGHVMGKRYCDGADVLEGSSGSKFDAAM
jgi:hypothetical protein